MKAYENAYTAFDESGVPEYMVGLQEAQTLDGLFRARVGRTPDAEAYRYYSKTDETWKSLSWRAASDQVARWQSALHAEGLRPGDRVAVMMQNCVYWVILDQAVLSLGLVLVPLYANDRPDNLAYVLQDSGAKLLLIREQEQADQLERVAQQVRQITLISVLPVQTTQLEVKLVSDWLPEQGQLVPGQHGPDMLASIVYTSGTTGRPKGVMLSHKNMLWNAWSGLHSVMVYPEDQHLSFLPLSHTLERTVGYYLMIMAGARVAFNRSIPELAEDLQLIRPTVMVAVPRIFERVYARVLAALEQGSVVKRLLFMLAVATGWQNFLQQQGRAGWSIAQLVYPLMDRLVGRKIRQRLGGRLRIAIVGGAPMPEDVSRVFLGLGIPLLQGYGLTETSPVISVNTDAHNDPASVGELLRDVEISHDPETQELWVKSPGVMQGYWRQEDASRDVMTVEGWLRTGDIARYTNGYLYITGRIKDILVLANGEKVAPADIENVVATDPLIEQLIVIGEGRPYLSALLVLDQEAADRWFSRAASRRSGTREEVLRDELSERMRDKLKRFPGYAKIIAFEIVDQPWTIENEMLTPTLKLRRARVLEYYAERIDALYAGHA